MLPRAIRKGIAWRRALAILDAMAKDSLTLSDVRRPHLWLRCDECGRRGRFNVARLLEHHGDARLTDLRLELAQCRRKRTGSVHDVCKAVYEGL